MAAASRVRTCTSSGLLERAGAATDVLAVLGVHFQAGWISVQVVGSLQCRGMMRVCLPALLGAQAPACAVWAACTLKALCISAGFWVFKASEGCLCMCHEV